LSIAAVAGIRELDLCLYGGPRRLSDVHGFGRTTARQWKGCPPGQPFFVRRMGEKAPPNDDDLVLVTSVPLPPRYDRLSRRADFFSIQNIDC
jgi:hypothetical protein